MRSLSSLALCRPLLPHLHLSSPLPPRPALQAVMGSLVKRLLAPLLPGLGGYSSPPGPSVPSSMSSPASRVYHATVMPCYDKKLEAVREELVLPGGERLPEVRSGCLFHTSHQSRCPACKLT